LNLNSNITNKRLEVKQPVLTNMDIERIRRIEDRTGGAFKTKTLSLCYIADFGETGMATALKRLCKQAKQAVLAKNNILILSDREVDADHIAIPALLATSAVHQFLIREGLRTSTGLVVESGEVREVHHFAVLAGYGAEAINPYLAFDTLLNCKDPFTEALTDAQIEYRYIKALAKGLHKVMSKMGISTYQSYCGAQQFNAVGLAKDFLDEFFTGTPSTTGGAGLAEIAAETVARHRLAFSNAPLYRALDVGGEFAYRVKGENHIWTPSTISKLQHATRSNNSQKYAEFANEINEQNENLLTLRGLFEFKFSDHLVPLEEVEPASAIVKRFATGAMSFGSISFEAHTTLAIAMNRIGGKSNTGEGGELPERFKPMSHPGGLA
jgi:glutamate synthase (NADPH/NADH) large chain